MRAFRAAVFVLSDGTLSNEERAILRNHISGVALLKLPQFRSAACPGDGTSERLLAIAALVEDRYVIQLDSDTLTVGTIDEVRDCLRQQKAFALGTWDRQVGESMLERWETANKLQPGARSHVQLMAEANFDKLKDFTLLRYVRGCSGFARFPAPVVPARFG